MNDYPFPQIIWPSYFLGERPNRWTTSHRKWCLLFLLLWKNMDTDIGSSSQSRIPFEFRMFRSPTVVLSFFIPVCIRDEINVSAITSDEDVAETLVSWRGLLSWRFSHMFPLRGQWWREMILLGDNVSNLSLIRAKALSQPPSQTLPTEHPQPSFKLLSCLLPQHWEMAHWTKASLKAKQRATG